MSNVYPISTWGVPAHKQTDPAKATGQISFPLPEGLIYKPAHGGYPDPSKDKK
jgi:hypothetical protein